MLWIILATVGSFAAGVVLTMAFSARVAGSKSVADQVRQPEQADGARIHAQTEAPAEMLGASPQQPSIAADPAEGMTGLPAGRRYAATAVLGGLVALAIAGLYASIEPTEPAASYSAARSEGAQAVERLAALTQQPEVAASAPKGGGLASVADMIDRLVARLRERPNDPEGWRMLGWSYFHTQRFNEAAAAYQKAIELRPDFAEFRSFRGEALVSAANGTVTADATRMFDEALALNSTDPRARFFKGLAKAQAGDKTSALEDWIALLKGADPNEPWNAEVMQKATALGQEIGVDVSARVGRRQAAASGDILRALAGPPPAASAGHPGPTRPDLGADKTTPPSDQAAMVRGMIERLAARLEQSPRDVEGWIKLMRSRVVLGEAEEATRALERALAVFDDAPQERSRIADAARELGVKQ